jgi:hypothetical protein
VDALSGNHEDEVDGSAFSAKDDAKRSGYKDFALWKVRSVLVDTDFAGR